MSNVPQMENDSQSTTGVFPPQKARIVEARSCSGEDIYKNGKPVDIGIEFVLDIGKEWKPKYTITGNYKLVDGVYKPSTTTRVKIAFQRLGVKWTRLEEGNHIPKDILDQCIGKEIYTISYCKGLRSDGSGKPSYVLFGEFFQTSVDNAKEKLIQKFNDSVSQGFVKVFDLAAVSAAPSTTASADTVLPFENQF